VLPPVQLLHASGLPSALKWPITRNPDQYQILVANDASHAGGLQQSGASGAQVSAASVTEGRRLLSLGSPGEQGRAGSMGSWGIMQVISALPVPPSCLKPAQHSNLEVSSANNLRV